MKGIVVSLFDCSGIMLRPWADAGYECWAVDIQNAHDVESNPRMVSANLSVPWLPPFCRDRIVFVSAFPPCTHLAVSGARWMRGKGLRKLADSISMFATAAEFCEWSEAPYMIENPVSTIATHWRSPDHYFHPYYFTGYRERDNYTKKTCLWTGGGFVMPEKFMDNDLGSPDDRIHKCPPSLFRGDQRSLTPEGFAIATFNANQGVAQCAT